MFNKMVSLLSVWIVLTFCISCQKEFLAKKSNKALLVPTALSDFDALLDAVTLVNYNYPSITTVASDDFHVVENGYLALDIVERAAYVWDESIFDGVSLVHDWDYQYSKIFHANVVLDGLKEFVVTDNNRSEFDRVKGTALFHRAFSYYSLSQVFMDPFLTTEMGRGPGLFLRFEADIGKEVPRSTVAQTYDLIISDLEDAAELLPVNSLYKTRPNKNAAWALLARIYLSISEYEKAKLYADKCLAANSELLDYNRLDTTLINPFPHALTSNNEEIIYYSNLILYRFLSSSLVGIDTLLYSSYTENDMRKTMYFTSREGNLHSFTGNYSGTSAIFGGLANDELLLIRAECLAREGNVVLALNDLNYLLENRYRETFFEPVQLTDANELLDLILLERRKELVGRGLRWSDLRRLNHEDGYSKTLYRYIGGERYELLPRAEFYTFSIPDYEE